jgi:outer membrane protein assembly factor BamB
MSTHHHARRSWFKPLLASCVGLAAVAGCGGFGGNAGNDGGRDGADITEVPAGNFVVAWKARLPIPEGAQIKRITLSEDKVFAYDTANRVYFLDRAKGTLAATGVGAKPQDTIHDPVALKDRVVVPSTTQLNVFTPEGKKMHTINLRYGASGGAAGEGRMVFFGVDAPNGGRVQAVDTKPQPYDVSPQWELQTGAQVSARPATFQGLVFAGSRNGQVFAVRADNRDPLWPGLEKGTFPTGGEILAPLAADKDGVYVPSMDSKLYCLNMNNGRVNWTFYAGAPLRDASGPVATSPPPTSSTCTSPARASSRSTRPAGWKSAPPSGSWRTAASTSRTTTATLTSARRTTRSSASTSRPARSR